MSESVEKKALEGLEKSKGNHACAVEKALKDVLGSKSNACNADKPLGAPESSKPACSEGKKELFTDGCCKNKKSKCELKAEKKKQKDDEEKKKEEKKKEEKKKEEKKDDAKKDKKDGKKSKK